MQITRLVVLAWLPLSGCVAGVAAEAVSVGATGKTLGDHALSAGTGKDCKVLEGTVRSDRDVCEEPGSPATKRDTKGDCGQPGHGQPRQERVMHMPRDAVETKPLASTALVDEIGMFDGTVRQAVFDGERSDGTVGKVFHELGARRTLFPPPLPGRSEAARRAEGARGVQAPRPRAGRGE